MGKREDRGLIRYEKKDDPNSFTFFTPESIMLYDPAKAGWVPSVAVEYAAPVEVKNFMADKKVEKCTPVEIKLSIEDAPEFKGTPAPDVTEYITTPISRLGDALTKATDESLLEIIKIDERTTAKKMAEKELKNRE